MTDELSRKPGDPINGSTYGYLLTPNAFCITCRHTLEEGDCVTHILVDTDHGMWAALAHTQPCPITRPQNIRSCDIPTHNHIEHDPKHQHPESMRF